MLDKLGQAWRVSATGFSFVVFGIGGTILPLIVFPIYRLFIRNIEERKRLARHTVHHVFRFFVWMMGALQIYKLTIGKIASAEDCRGKVLIANHPTLIDVVILISVFKNADCIVKNSLWSNPFIGGVVRGTGYISNGDPDGLISDCKKSLDSGNILIIFPEGTRTKSGERTIKFQRGAANIASRCQADFLPAVIDVSEHLLNKEKSWYQVPAKQPKFDIRFYPMISVDKFAQLENQGIAARNLTKEIEHYYRGLMK